MDYGSINAKVKAMRGRLLKKDDYYSLAESANVYELGTRLKEYEAYTDFIDKVTSSSPDFNRHGLEERLILLAGNDYRKIYNFLSDKMIKSYLKAFMLKTEIHLIKFMLCSLYDDRDLSHNYEEMNTLSMFDYGIDISALSASNTLGEFIDNLKGTEFYDVLNASYVGTDLFDIEMSLDFYYYNNLWKAKNKYLNGNNKKIMSMINGAEIDLQNIMWIYRLKTYYNVPNDLIYQYVIPITYKVNNGQIMRLIEASGELFDEIKNTYYGFAFSDKKRIEKMYYQAMGKTYKYALHNVPDSISVIVEYLFRKHIEVENVISLVEGVRYSLKPDDVMKFLYLPEDYLEVVSLD